MTRKKVQLAYIVNDSARKTTYKKRKRGLMKKMHEITTLCGVEACCIIYSPYDAEPVLWPENAAAVQGVLAHFRSIPEMEQSKKMVNQETFLRERIVKIKDHLKKQLKDNREQEMVEVMFQCLICKLDLGVMNMMDLNDLAWLIDQYIREIDLCLERLRRGQGNAAGLGSIAAGGDDLVADSKPPTQAGLNPLAHPFFPANPSSFGGMQNALWFSAGMGNIGESSSSNQLQFGLPRGSGNNGGMMMPPPPPSPLYRFPGESSNIGMMMPPPPPPLPFEFHGGSSNIGMMMPPHPPQPFRFPAGGSSNIGMMMPPPPPSGFPGGHSTLMMQSEQGQSSGHAGGSDEMMPPPPPPPQFNMSHNNNNPN